MTVKELINKLTELPEDMELDNISDICIPQIAYSDPIKNFFMSNACKNCSNHPSNGGSGICHCILGASSTTW